MASTLSSSIASYDTIFIALFFSYKVKRQSISTYTDAIISHRSAAASSVLSNSTGHTSI
jgi:hypothetical protein